MAGDWIKVENTTPDKPEVYQLAEILNIDPDAVTGKLFRIWVWADEQTHDGNAHGVTKTLLDRITAVSGFANALLQVGWLTESDNGLEFPNFERHNGKTAKTRAETNRRVSKHRNKKQICNANSVTDGVTKELQKPLPEKRREENNKLKTINKINAGAGELAEFPVALFDPGDEDLEACRSLSLDSPLEQIIAEFRVYHAELQTTTTMANWSRLLVGWVRKRVLPPARGHADD